MAKVKYKVSFKDNGVKQAIQGIRKKYPKIEEKALREGIVVFAEELEKNTPVGPYRKPDKYGPNTNYSSTHMKEDVKWQKQGVGTYVAGYGMHTAWRAVFVNNGTIHINGQHFFEKSVSNTENEVSRKIEDVIRRELF